MAAFSSFCLCHPPISLKTKNFAKTSKIQQNVRNIQGCALFLKNHKTVLFGQAVGLGIDTCRSRSFIGGLKVIAKPELRKNVLRQKRGGVYASWLANSQIASSAFTLGTVAVLPFYTLMVLAPKSALTRRSMQSNVPYVLLGFLYAYLLYLSWTPETARLIFASKYLLPEVCIRLLYLATFLQLPGILKMFSSEMALASAWIHLLVVDLFSARQVYYDGLENQIETRHSVSLCLFFCPVGILIHVITKALARTASTSNHNT